MYNIGFWELFTPQVVYTVQYGALSKLITNTDGNWFHYPIIISSFVCGKLLLTVMYIYVVSKQILEKACQITQSSVNAELPDMFTDLFLHNVHSDNGHVYLCTLPHADTNCVTVPSLMASWFLNFAEARLPGSVSRRTGRKYYLCFQREILASQKAGFIHCTCTGHFAHPLHDTGRAGQNIADLV